MAVATWAGTLPGTSGATEIRSQGVDSRSRWAGRLMRVRATRNVSLWRDEEAADGKIVEAEEGIFENLDSSRLEVSRRGKNRLEAPMSGLVPEKWRELQDDLNKTKRQKRREFLKSTRARSKDDKLKLREKIAEIIDTAIEAENLQANNAQDAASIFPGSNDQGLKEKNSTQRTSKIEEISLSEENGKVAEPKTTRKIVPDDPRRCSSPLSLQMDPEKPDRNSSKAVNGPAKAMDRDAHTIDKTRCERWMPLHTLSSPAQSFLVADLMQDAHAGDVNEGRAAAALYRAVRAGRLAIVRHFIRRGADVFYTDEDGATLLHHAVASGSAGVVRSLLKCGLHINAVDKAGWTPLHVAVRCQKRDVLSVLISSGADWRIANEDGDTPLDLAARSKMADS